MLQKHGKDDAQKKVTEESDIFIWRNIFVYHKILSKNSFYK